MTWAHRQPATLGLLVLACLASLPALGGRLGTRQPPVLYVSQWSRTDQQGSVVTQLVQAHLGQPGSTADGLQASWALALDQPVAAAALAVQPLLWADPVAAITPFTPFGGSLVAPGGSAFPYGITAGGLPPVAVAVPTLADLQAAADRGVQAQAAALAAALAALLRERGANTAWFRYRQEVVFAGQPVWFFWNLHAEANGTWFAGTATLEASGTRGLAVRYTSLTAAQGLPAGYRYPDGGWLRWQLLDAGGQPLGAVQGADTQGAFDGAGGLACLLGQSGAGLCPRPDLVLTALALRLGAASVEMQYVAGLQPAFAATQGGARLALAQLQVSRQLRGRGADCALPPWQFVNIDQAAFQLQADTRHFLRDAQGHWSELPGQRTLLAGPLLPWRTLTVAVGAGDLADLSGEVIDPDRGTRVRLDRFLFGVQPVQVGPLACQPVGS